MTSIISDIRSLKSDKVVEVSNGFDLSFKSYVPPDSTHFAIYTLDERGELEQFCIIVAEQNRSNAALKAGKYFYYPLHPAAGQ